MIPMMSLSFMMIRSSPSSLTSVPDHLPNSTRSPTLTSSGWIFPSSPRAPGPTATISPSDGFSWAVSGMMMPPRVFSSWPTRRITTRSCSGRKPMRPSCHRRIEGRTISTLRNRVLTKKLGAMDAADRLSGRRQAAYAGSGWATRGAARTRRRAGFTALAAAAAASAAASLSAASFARRRARRRLVFAASAWRGSSPAGVGLALVFIVLSSAGAVHYPMEAAAALCAVVLGGLVDNAVGLAAERSRQCFRFLFCFFLIADDRDQRRSTYLLLRVVKLRDGRQQPVKRVFELQSDEHFSFLRRSRVIIGRSRRDLTRAPGAAAGRATARVRGRSARAGPSRCRPAPAPRRAPARGFRPRGALRSPVHLASSLSITKTIWRFALCK